MECLRKIRAVYHKCLIGEATTPLPRPPLQRHGIHHTMEASFPNSLRQFRFFDDEPRGVVKGLDQLNRQ
ncbi:MAG: hypothetical protein ACPL7J_09195, partial [Desulfomonilaceae bacterium]